MLKNEIYLEIDSILREYENPKFAESRNRLIDKDTTSYGVETSIIRKLIGQYVDSNSTLINTKGLEISENLLSSKVFDIQMAGVFVASYLNKSTVVIDKSKLAYTYKRWIESYIKDWAICDTFSTEVLSPALQDNGRAFELLDLLSESQNKWARRSALVSLIKAKSVFKNWHKVMKELLRSYGGEKDPIIKKAILWAKRELKTR